VKHLLETLGPRFTCVVLASSGAIPAEVVAFARSAEHDVKVVCITDVGVLQAYDAAGGAVMLVRPDGHVAGRWRKPSEATLHDALARACGRAGAKH
jgi:3-(3-hydroxy-phenyl)propionate hydroxylase